MAVPHSVLVAVDFGDASARAVSVGGLIAERCRAKLRLVHSESIEAPIYFTSEQLARLERERHALQKQAEQYLEWFGGQHTTVGFSVAVDSRPAVDVILRESIAADLVIMGTHGRQGPRRWWLGSVAERVLREITRPLLIVRAGHDDPDASLFDRIVVHAAAPAATAPARQFAHDLATCLGGHVIDGRHEPLRSTIDPIGASLVAVSIPQPRTAAWLSSLADPLVRSSSVPVLFVPEVEGASP